MAEWNNKSESVGAQGSESAAFQIEALESKAIILIAHAYRTGSLKAAVKIILRLRCSVSILAPSAYN